MNQRREKIGSAEQQNADEEDHQANFPAEGFVLGASRLLRTAKATRKTDLTVVLRVFHGKGLASAVPIHCATELGVDLRNFTGQAGEVFLVVTKLMREAEGCRVHLAQVFDLANEKLAISFELRLTCGAHLLCCVTKPGHLLFLQVV